MVCGGEAGAEPLTPGELKDRYQGYMSLKFVIAGLATRTAAGCCPLLSSSRLRPARPPADAAPSMRPVTDQSAAQSVGRVSGNSASTTSCSPAAAAAVIGLVPLLSAASGLAPACSGKYHSHGSSLLHPLGSVPALASIHAPVCVRP